MLKVVIDKLRHEDQLSVVGEDEIDHVGATIQSERLPNEFLEMPAKIIGQEKGRDVIVRMLRENLVACEKRKAMRPLYTLDMPLLCQNLIEQTTSAAISVEDVDFFVVLAA